MHVILTIMGGAVLLGLCVLFGHLWGGARTDLAVSAKIFIPVWLVMAITNMWIGVAKAGYTVREELPILLLVFTIPAAIAVLFIWRLHR
jgi:hypothetical protein